jgi:hypothetical protein
MNKIKKALIKVDAENKDYYEADYPKVIYLDNETKQWSDPHKLADIASSNLNIAFSSTGVGYISFTDDNNHAIVFKYTDK